MFASKVKDTIQELIKEQKEMGSRFIETIPYGSSIDNCTGFISITGKNNEFPVLTFCIEKPAGGSIVTNMVFSSVSHFEKFASTMLTDAVSNFHIQMEEN